MQNIPAFNVYPCEKDDIESIVNGINEYNLSKVPAIADVWTPLEFIAKDDEGLKLGGVLGGIGYWNGLEIKFVWVHEDYRGKGLGTQLLGYIEKMAKQRGAEIAMLDTFDFQAEGFYLKNGYTPIGEIPNFPKGHRRVYLTKRLL